MSYNAHQHVEEFPSFLENKSERAKKIRELAMEGCASFYMCNDFTVCSAYHPDKIEGPWDVVQEAAADSSENSDEGGDFSWDDKDIERIEEEVRAEYPDHKDTEEVLAELKRIREREENGGHYTFHCY